MKRQIARFLATGAISVAMNVLVIVALTEWVGLHYLVSTGVCFLSVTTLSFVLNRTWTFRKRGGAPVVDFARYALVVLVNLALSLLLTYVLVDYGVPYPVATVLLSLLFVPASFLVHRRWSFNVPWQRT